MNSNVFSGPKSSQHRWTTEPAPCPTSSLLNIPDTKVPFYIQRDLSSEFQPGFLISSSLIPLSVLID